MFLDRDLIEAREKYEEARRAQERIAYLSKEAETLRPRVDELAAQRKAEERDVERLENGSLAAFFYNLLGKGEEKLDKERAEALEAAVRHDAAAAQLDAVEVEMGFLRPVANALAAHSVRLENLRAEKKQRILSADPAAADRIEEMEETAAGYARQLRELEEALHAGQKALSTARDAVHELEEAESYGSWDVLGGGLLADMGKYDKLEKAQTAINRLQGELRLFRSELLDVNIRADIDLRIDDVDKFLDMFWDNIFTDWSTLDRITKALEQTRSVRDRVRRTLDTLEGQQPRLTVLRRDAQDALNAFVEAHHVD